ncbi:hypothetical protein E4T48_06979 [Aureobasidium sp. EXF-10727]|nr:hypothetical protein E4T48_06979 [Aureobasidium sp. EXF-10727]
MTSSYSDPMDIGSPMSLGTAINVGSSMDVDTDMTDASTNTVQPPPQAPPQPTHQPSLPRGYSVPFPPDIPALGLDEYGNRTVIQLWSDVRDNYTTRLKADKSAFEVREVNHDDPTGMGKRWEGDWPQMYPVGPPSEQPDYHPIHEKYGLKVLNAAGFINTIQPKETAATGPAGRLNKGLSSSFWRNPTKHSEEFMHPVLRYDMWRGISKDEYALITPGLLLASAILDDPTTLNYFYAIQQPADVMQTVFGPGLTCKITDVPATLTNDEQYHTYQAICAMRQHTSFSIAEMEDTEYDAYGVTKLQLDQSNFVIPAARPKTTIILDDNYLKVLSEIKTQIDKGKADTMNPFWQLQRMARIPAHKRENIDALSVQMRTHLMLACTVIHELAHAFCNAYFESLTPFIQPREPWLRGTRSNEQGCCLENFVLGGLPRAMVIAIPPISHLYTMGQSVAMPFGAWFEDHWDQWFDADTYPQSTVIPVNGALEYGQCRRMYPILQEWFQRMFGDDMWENQVQRFGLEAVKMPKLPWWQLMYYRGGSRGLWATGEERWNMNEHIAKTQNWI